ncbi:MAG: tetratricopeptide repeat protein, partial [Proteobacteria bacterium]|nr:tetratricopeptide repeat protein [Pseudomonadota bacterium]
PYYRRALAVQQAALGPDHPDLADTLDNYADILVMNGQGAKAARFKERAARIRAKAG